jgi:hypothetical protein
LSELNPHILEKLSNWKKSPLIFTQECIDWRGTAGVTFQQVEALQAVTKEKRITIRSGHGCGKDAISALIALWFMSTRPGAKVVVTAPTNRQLNDIFWSELSKWFKRSMLQDEFIQQKDKFFHVSDPKGWWIRIVSPQVSATKDSQAETLAGFHGDHLLIIADEASGIPDPFFIPLEGAMTQEDNKAILIGNMTKNTGYFYDTHFHSKLSKRWHKLHWDSRKSPIVTDDMVKFFEDKYGVDSNVFAIRVAGNPPKDNANTLISLYDAKECMKNEIEPAEDEPLYLSADVARYGEDVSIILPRKGLKIFPWETHDNLNTISLGGHINQSYQELDADGLSIDEIGVGAGVTDWLQKHGHLKCFGINVAAKSSNIAKFDRLRDELWVAMRDKCVSHLYDIPDTEEGEELCNELASPVYDFNVHGGYKIESKREMKARGVMSPNIADALGLSEYFSNLAYRVWGKKKKKKSTGFFTSALQTTRHGWMTA